MKDYSTLLYELFIKLLRVETNICVVESCNKQGDVKVFIQSSMCAEYYHNFLNECRIEHTYIKPNTLLLSERHIKNLTVAMAIEG